MGASPLDAHTLGASPLDDHTLGASPLDAHTLGASPLDARLLDARTSYQVSSALMELSEFLITANERDTKNRQKLLRNLRVCKTLAVTCSLML